ncbi:YdcH family protein [Agrobacterium sp. ES01]|uniref:YdcH family protein n=1 Tax=Agrobacterium sp. ES01 TaxID=3420714 RepID=UPI003D14CDC2
MSNTPHKLADEFPQFTALMHHLKETDGHFARLFENYQTVNSEIHRAETNIEPTDDAHMEVMRKERMQLKDEIYGMLVRHEPEAEMPDVK